MHFCPANQSLSVSDYHLTGLSPCLTDTITSSVVSGIAVLGSVIQLSVYVKYATHTDRYTSLKSKLFKLHLLLHALLICLPIAKLFTTVYKLQGGVFYIYQILHCCFQGKSCFRISFQARIENGLTTVRLLSSFFINKRSAQCCWLCRPAVILFQCWFGLALSI